MDGRGAGQHAAQRHQMQGRGDSRQAGRGDDGGALANLHGTGKGSNSFVLFVSVANVVGANGQLGEAVHALKGRDGQSTRVVAVTQRQTDGGHAGGSCHGQVTHALNLVEARFGANFSHSPGQPTQTDHGGDAKAYTGREMMVEGDFAAHMQQLETLQSQGVLSAESMFGGQALEEGGKPRLDPLTVLILKGRSDFHGSIKSPTDPAILSDV